MREELKKTLAVILSLVMVMTLILVPEKRIVAGTEVNVYEGNTWTVREGDTSNAYYVASELGELTVNGTVTGGITIHHDGIVIVGSNGKVQGGRLAVDGKGTLTNKGSIEKVCIDNEYEAVVDSTVTNSGTITTYLICDASESGKHTLTMEATSRITDLSVEDRAPMFVITATDGAQIKNADIKMNRLSETSNGSVTITDSLKMGVSALTTANMPSGLQINVGSETKITKTSEADGWYVYYDGKKYLLPAGTFSDKTISDLYNITVSTDKIALDDLTVGYSAEETATDTFTISNTGSYKMNWKLTSIPDFIELYDADGIQLATGYTATLVSGDSRIITVKAKTGKGADKYTGSIGSQVLTAETTTPSNKLMSEPAIDVSLNVNKKDGSGTVTATDVYYGTPIQVSATSDTNDGGYVIEYKLRDGADSTYSTTKPKKVGEYTARATFSSTDIFKEFIDYANFAILRKVGVGTVSVADLYYGEDLTPVVSSSTNGTENVTYKYKEKGADDSTYTGTKPTKAGAYTVQATFAKTDVYSEVIATADFNILRKEGTGVITIPDICCGEKLVSLVSSATNGTDNVTIEYKKKGADDSAYTKTAPEVPGEYTARATFAKTDAYFAVVATTDFTITYLESPESSYSVRGKQGKNDYYTSDVVILPTEGYLISDSLNGTYKESLKISKTSEAFNIYLKKIETGQKTAGIEVPAINIDADAPTILNAPSGEKVYGEQVEITIKDDNLSQVLVNGEQVEFEDNKAVILLSSNFGEETYEIVCTDVAGNTSKRKIIVAADWMKEMNIPSGAKVRLSEEQPYQLDGGTWQVAGDNTTYAGGSTFYVGSDGEYTFTKVD